MILVGSSGWIVFSMEKWLGLREYRFSYVLNGNAEKFMFL